MEDEFTLEFMIKHHGEGSEKYGSSVFSLVMKTDDKEAGVKRMIEAIKASVLTKPIY